MISRANGVMWMEGEGEDAISSWTRNNEVEHKNDGDMAMNACASLSSFKSMVENDWYMNTTINPPHQNLQTSPNHPEIKDMTFCPNPNAPSDNLLLQPMDSSSSCSPSQAFNLDPSQSQSFFPPKSCYSSFLNVLCNNPFDNAFDLGCDNGFLPPTSNPPVLMGFNGLDSQSQMGALEPTPTSVFPTTRLLPFTNTTGSLGNEFNPPGFGGLDSSANPLFLNRPKVLRPLEVSPSIGTQPTLFQKRAALRQSSGGADKFGSFGFLGSRAGEGPIGINGNWARREMAGGLEKKRKRNDEGEIDEASIDVSGLNYDSDEAFEKEEESAKNGGNNSNANSAVTGGDHKGKKKGLPAKNLMAERRRRKKLNDRLYMLRSVVPKISKMDRASILGDAIEYLKELLQRINDLHNELESNSPGSLLPPSTSFHPLTPSTSTLPCRVKEELCQSSLPSPKNQPARVEVRAREGRAVNIHMFCARRPGLLLSTMRALDNLGLDIQQAVISCFNGFALDVFRAEQCTDDQDIPPEHIKAVLMDSAGYHGVVQVE